QLARRYLQHLALHGVAELPHAPYGAVLLHRYYRNAARVMDHLAADYVSVYQLRMVHADVHYDALVQRLAVYFLLKSHIINYLPARLLALGRHSRIYITIFPPVRQHRRLPGRYFGVPAS